MIKILQIWEVARNRWLVILLFSFLLICALVFWFWNRAQKAEEQYQRAVVLQNEQMGQVETLSQDLHISEMNAKELQAAYDAEKRKPPAASFTVRAPSLQAAAEQVAERINKQGVTLPLAAVAQTDRTAVVKNDEEYKVDVLKINLDKPWEVSAGIGNHWGDMYIPVGLQRNYATHKAVAAEVHLVPEDLVKGKIKTSGWEVKHVWRY